MKNTIDTEIEELVLDETKNSDRLILHNDDYNTFEHVISCMRIYLGMTFDQGYDVAITIHTKGHETIKEGDKEELEALYHLLQQEGLTVSIN